MKKIPKSKQDLIDIMVEISDPDGAWAMFKDQGDMDACLYIEAKYFAHDN